MNVITRAIATVLPGERVIDDGDMLLWRALPSEQRDHLGPFVVIDHYRRQSKRGIGDRPHPHAGIEVLSYLLHAEQPQGGRHGLQLWAALPPSQKLVEPAFCL